MPWRHKLKTSFVLTACICALGQEPPAYAPNIASPSSEGVRAIGAFHPVEGFKVELFAAEPMLANPVAFYIDHQGSFYVAETFRHHKGVSDMRGHRDWLVDDLAARTLEDRLVAMKKNLGNDFPGYTVEHDRVRFIADDDGDGKADRAEVFADGFKDALAGIGAGLLVDRGNVFYTCIPELWKLRDEDGDGKSDTRDVLSSGYGVHIGFLGHDLHGLRKGPDGRIYFSIGDRGAHVKTFDAGIIDEPDTGAVFRCFPDGTCLEIVHRGLRNPQELAFDDFGNLFTGDNNSDGGDQARWVWIVDGGDSGWRIGYQWITEPNSRGPWNAEKMWEPYHEGQPAHIVPPLANIGAGPSGLSYYPGTGMPETYRGYFFMCDFRGDANVSLVHAIKMSAKGASFEIADRHDFLKGMLVTDCDFGMRAGLYATDWTQGWNQPMKGRIYRIFNSVDDLAMDETRAILAEGMTNRSVADLAALLSHADQRVRYEAQWALADRGDDGRQTLLSAAQKGGTPLARLHGIWGLWHLGLRGIAPEELVALVDDPVEEVRAQSARVLGDVRFAPALQSLAAKLNNQTPRVKFFFAQALARMPKDESGAARSALLTLLRDNANADAYLRHAAVMGLNAQASETELAVLTADDSAPVRLGALLVLRRLHSEATAKFLGDADTFIRTEAARAIHDEGIADAMPVLSQMDPDAAGADNAAFSRRVLNARFRLGGADGAESLAAYASSAAPANLRAEAIAHLALWTSPPALDRVTGAWRPMTPGKATDAVAALQPRINALIAADDIAVAKAGCAAAAALRMANANDELFDVVNANDKDHDLRAAALRALGVTESPRLRKAIDIAHAAGAPALRSEAVTQLSAIDPGAATVILKQTVERGETEEKQVALALLGEMTHPAAETIISAWMDRLIAGNSAMEIQLDILDAARTAKTESLKTKLAVYDASLSPGDPLAKYRPALFGGNPRNGSRVFYDEASVSCMRCHVMLGRGGGEVGPELTHIAAKYDREYLLAAVAVPNHQIAEGYENVSLTLKDGRSIMGRMISETDAELVLEVSFVEEDPFADPQLALAHSTVDVTAEGAAPGARVPLPRITIAKSEIESRVKALSSMPTGLAEILSPRQLRDLIAFLAERK
ncbi:MAG: PVC-type heme-binding CxxCH protein [Candidatus Hydrogenedentes bacterium]|nr:PVC-type heme-binding CxxCH protein [Candidatus Hydrogenedentota bacterium]